MTNFWISEGIKVIAFFCITFALGKWLVQKGVKVNYTRKIFHFVFFFFPLFTATLFPYEFSIKLTMLSGCVLLACLLLMYQPIRHRSNFLTTAFSSIDRPEDRPFTLIWVSTQLLAPYLVLTPIEGSLCVLISGIIAVLLHNELLNQYELILSLLIIPIAMTLAEALSPHTWDGPFLYLVGGVSTVLVLEIAQIGMSA